MSDTTKPKCPFRATLITRSYFCEHAEEITRREGPDIGCNSMPANRQCVEFFSQLKVKALVEMGYEDDLTTLPASVLQKIQYGGLLGLAREIDFNTDGNTIDNIKALLESARQQYQSIDSLPYQACIAAIKDFKMKRRRDR